VRDLDTIVPRIWQRDPSVWLSPGRESDVAAKSIANRLGWLDAPEAMRAHVDRVNRLAEIARTEGVRDVYLIGMGGSSLCAEVMRTSHRAAAGSEEHPELHVLDTTDEQALTGVVARADPARTWFLVSSKSGGTVEVASMERYFWSAMKAALGDRAGAHFVAITDPGTALEALAKERSYRVTFLNPPDIGGRFSALTLFGLVPAALLGIDVEHLLRTASEMAAGCRQESGPLNPGLALGAFMARECRHGRDKLTVLLPPSLRSLGLWIEQLVAESTGKHGTGILPIVDEDPLAATAYGPDRAFVSLETEKERLDVDFAAIEASKHPLMRLTLRADALGAEFFRWEFATAVAGAALEINPFDEPNVKEAKDRTRALLAQVAQTAALPDSPPAEGASIEALRALVGQLDPPRYLGILLYLPVESETLEAIEEFRSAVRDRTHVATTMGVGPRYLHSTGQYHKGGPDTGTFLVITGEDATSTPVPDAPYSFSVLKRAQAIGDLQALRAHGRTTVRMHVKDAQHRGAALRRIFTAAL
jgi:glucose-6-phosphate isomerase